MAKKLEKKAKDNCFYTQTIMRSINQSINQSPELTMAPNSQSSEAPTYNVMNIVSEKTIQWTNWR